MRCRSAGAPFGHHSPRITHQFDPHRRALKAHSTQGSDPGVVWLDGIDVLHAVAQAQQIHKRRQRIALPR